MAEFPGLALTNKGLELQTKAQAGKELNFSRVALGDGVVPPDPKILQTLVAEQKSLPLTSLLMIEAGHVRLRVVLTNDDVVAGFYIREVGVFAIDPDTGIEYLYAYSNAGEFADYMPAGGGATVVEHEVDLITVVGDAANLTATIDKSKVYATQQDLEDLHEIIDASNGVFATKQEQTELEGRMAEQYATEQDLTDLENRLSNQADIALDGPQLIYPGSSNNFTITNYSGFASYSASTTVGTANISDDQVILDIPIGEQSGGTVLTVTQDGAAKNFNIAIGSQSISKPNILAPTNNATNVGDEALLASSEFECFPSGEFTHTSTDYQIATDSNFTNIIWQSLTDTVNLLSVQLPAGELAVSTQYYLRIRHYGNSGAGNTNSAWSDTVSFTTSASFYAANEVAEIIPAELDSYESFGKSVAMASNASVIISGAPLFDGAGTNNGAAWVYNLEDYSEEVKILPDAEGGTALDFGRALDLSDDGLMAIVGSYGSGTAVSHAVIYTQAGGFWTEIQRIYPDAGDAQTRFGQGVAISGDASTVAIATNTGLSIFKNITGNTYTQTSVIISGRSSRLAISKNGQTVSLGSKVFRDAAGDGTSWVEKAVLSSGILDFSADGQVALARSTSNAYIYKTDDDGTWVLNTALPAQVLTDGYSTSGALSGDGRVAVIGSHDRYVHVFTKSSSDIWQFEKLITLPYSYSEALSVAVSVDGKIIAVGDHKDSTAGTYVGVVRIYK